MVRINVVWCVLPFLLLLGCSKDNMPDQGGDFATRHGGNPFKGSVVGIRSASGAETHRWDGAGRVAFIEQTADSVSLVLMADFDAVGEVNLKIRGAYGNDSFQATGSNLDFSIANGNIQGNAASRQQQFTFTGSITPTKSILNVRVEFLEGQEGFPQGSALELAFDTAREQPDGADDGTGCNLRLVPIWSPSGVTMGMVPDC